MKTLLGWYGLLLVASGLVAGILLPGCGGTASDPTDQLYGSFTALYSNPLGGAVVTTNSGNPVTFLNLTQSQGALRAVDNNGTVFTGTFSIAYAYGGMIQMDGVTGSRTPVHIAGYLEASGSNAWINASWIEPNLTGTMYGTAQVTPFSPTNPMVWTH